MSQLVNRDIFLLANHRSPYFFYELFKKTPTVNICVDGGVHFFLEESMIFIGDFDSEESFHDNIIEKDHQNLSDFEFALSLLPPDSLKFAFGFLGGDISHDLINTRLGLSFPKLCLLDEKICILSWSGKLSLKGDFTFSLVVQDEMEIQGAKYSGHFPFKEVNSLFSRNETKGVFTLNSKKNYLVAIDIISLEQTNDIIRQLILIGSSR